MTKKEFMQEAALRLLSTGTMTPAEVNDYVCLLTHMLWQEIDERETEDAAEAARDVRNADIEDLLREVDRRDIARAAQRQKEFDAKGRTYYRMQKSGYAKRMRRVFTREDINTVGDLIASGRDIFNHDRSNVGAEGQRLLDEVLKETYGITSWH